MAEDPPHRDYRGRRIIGPGERLPSLADEIAALRAENARIIARLPPVAPAPGWFNQTYSQLWNQGGLHRYLGIPARIIAAPVRTWRRAVATTAVVLATPTALHVMNSYVFGPGPEGETSEQREQRLIQARRQLADLLGGTGPLTGRAVLSLADQQAIAARFRAEGGPPGLSMEALAQRPDAGSPFNRAIRHFSHPTAYGALLSENVNGQPVSVAAIIGEDGRRRFIVDLSRVPGGTDGTLRLFGNPDGNQDVESGVHLGRGIYIMDDVGRFGRLTVTNQQGTPINLGTARDPSLNLNRDQVMRWPGRDRYYTALESEENRRPPPPEGSLAAPRLQALYPGQ